MTFQRIGIIGGGAWGTALAQSFCQKGLDVCLWAHESKTVEDINQHRENKTFLPGIELHENLKATSDFAELANCHAILIVTPVQFTRGIVERLHPHLKPRTPLVICSKGIEIKTGTFLSAVLSNVSDAFPLAVLSGPSFAKEVAKNLPVALTLACADQKLGMDLVHTLGQKYFRLYWSDDIIGAQVGGAVKNVMAIACGICQGKGFGPNAHAALMTRGFVELTLISRALGGRTETLSGLSGLGDLLLTCSNIQSRNMSLGVALGEGQSVSTILAERQSVTEGVYTATALYNIGQSLGLELPICSAVYHILQDKSDVDNAIEALLTRPFKAENLL